MKLQPIEKRSGLTPEEFREQYLLPGKPVVFKDLAAQWPATQKWTFEYLKKHYGQLNVPLFGNDFHDAGKGYMAPKIHMPFGDYLELIQAGPTELRMFLFNIFQHAPDLVKDVQIPTITDGFVKEYPFMFFGGQDAVVNLHYDIDCSSVFLTQFQTRKRVVLFAPDQSPYLYQHPFTVQSHVNVLQPDYERYPAFRKAQGWDTTPRTRRNHFYSLYFLAFYSLCGRRVFDCAALQRHDVYAPAGIVEHHSSFCDWQRHEQSVGADLETLERRKSKGAGVGAYIN